MATYTSNYNLEKPDGTDPFGDFRQSYNANMDIIDANLGGGGGSGGHTILDPDGNSLPQEDDLQFTGAVSVTDDNVNGRTVVNVEACVELTQAEYDALPASKLTDDIAYFVVDGESDEYKDKADKTDLASIQITGSTNNTGSTISSGTYFYLNDTLVRAIADISNGATLTLNTNYETVTIGALNEIMDLGYDVEYSATSNMTFSDVITWLYNNVDKTKITEYSKINIGGAIYTVVDSTSTYFTMSVTGTVPNGNYITNVLIHSTQRAFKTEMLTGGVTTTNMLNQTMIITGSKIKVKY